MSYLILSILILVVSYFAVKFYIGWSIKKEVLDVPNARSSHKTPTPRGGGIVIVIISISSILIYQLLTAETFAWSYIIGAVLIAFISWLDDIYSLSVIWRLICQSLAAFLIVWQFGFFEEAYLPIIGVLNLNHTGLILTILWIIWMTNAFNFMDGIDGIAALQAMTSACGWLIIGYLYNIGMYQFFSLVILFSTAGFLFHNWSPAKVFMGDVGSAFLGFTFAVFPFMASNKIADVNLRDALFFITIMFLWFFVFDTVTTIFRRAIKKEKIWKAHREHLYQMLFISNMKHTQISILYSIFSTIQIILVLLLLKKQLAELTFICISLLIIIILTSIVLYKRGLTK